jgi:hypothetical protein
MAKQTSEKISDPIAGRRPEKLNEFQSSVTEAHRQNADERIRTLGPGFEIIRTAYVARLKEHVPAFYEHGSLADLVALCEAFEEWSKAPSQLAVKCERAVLVESLLRALRHPPDQSIPPTLLP